MKKQICFIAPKFMNYIGGVESHGREFAKYFSNDEDYAITSIFSKKNIKDGILVNNYNLPNIKCQNILTVNFKKDAKQIINNIHKNTQIFFFNNPNWLPISKYIKEAFPNAKIIARSGGNDILAGWIGEENSTVYNLEENRQYLVKLINKYVDHLVVNSNYSFNRMLSIRIDNNKLVVLKGGVDCLKFRPNKDYLISNNEINIATSARLVKFKGIEHSLQTIKILNHLCDRKIFYSIIGDGPERKYLEKLTMSLGIDNITKFLGVKSFEEMPNVMKKFDIFLHLPINLKKNINGFSYIHTETMGRCFCEAAACGIPAVGSDVGGVSEIVSDCISGYIVKEGDYITAADKILTLIENAKLSKIMGINARKKAMSDFDWKILHHKYKSLFN